MAERGGRQWGGSETKAAGFWYLLFFFFVEGTGGIEVPGTGEERQSCAGVGGGRERGWALPPSSRDSFLPRALPPSIQGSPMTHVSVAREPGWEEGGGLFLKRSEEEVHLPSPSFPSPRQQLVKTEVTSSQHPYSPTLFLCLPPLTPIIHSFNSSCLRVEMKQV